MKNQKKRVYFNYKNKKIILKKCNEFEKFLGLMFVKKKNARALLFEFKKPTRISIHSFFVFFPFVSIWLDDKNKVIDINPLIKPFRFSFRPKEKFYKIIEIPINERYREVIQLLVGDKRFSKDLKR